MTNRILDKIIDAVQKKLVNVESSTTIPATTASQQPEDINNQRNKIYEVGRLTYLNEHNELVLAGLPKGYENNPYYVELESKALEEMRAYNEYIAVAKANAAAAGVTSEELDKYSQQCKEFYLQELKKEQDYQKNVKIIINNQGITCINELTGEISRFDIYCNPLTE